MHLRGRRRVGLCLGDGVFDAGDTLEQLRGVARLLDVRCLRVVREDRVVDRDGCVEVARVERVLGLRHARIELRFLGRIPRVRDARQLGADLLDEGGDPLLEALARLAPLEVGDGLARGERNDGRQVLYAEDLRDLRGGIRDHELQAASRGEVREVGLQLLRLRRARRAHEDDNGHLGAAARDVFFEVGLGHLEEGLDAGRRATWLRGRCRLGARVIACFKLAQIQGTADETIRNSHGLNLPILQVALDGLDLAGELARHALANIGLNHKTRTRRNRAYGVRGLLNDGEDLVPLPFQEREHGVRLVGKAGFAHDLHGGGDGLGHLCGGRLHNRGRDRKSDNHACDSTRASHPTAGWIALNDQPCDHPRAASAKGRTSAPVVVKMPLPATVTDHAVSTRSVTRSTGPPAAMMTS